MADFAEPDFFKHCSGYHLKFMDGMVAHCTFGTGPCGFRVLVFKGADGAVHQKSWEQRFPTEERGCRLNCLSFPCGLQADRVNRVAHRLPAAR